MPDLGLIGYPLSHSHSPGLFAEIFKKEGLNNWNYKLFPIKEVNQIYNLIEHEPELIGLNVTIPYKVDVIPLLNSISDEAKEIGAVNTIFIERNNGITLHGYNTDVFGFEALLNQLPYKEPTLVLGSGGASKAVVYALKKQKTDFLVVSRNKKENTINYQDIDAEILNKYKIIANTTPLGMYPLIDKMPTIPMDLITEKHTLLDLIYNPGETLLMQKFKSRGAKTLNGMIMLQQQAEKAWKIFNSHTK